VSQIGLMTLGLLPLRFWRSFAETAEASASPEKGEVSRKRKPQPAAT